MLKIVGLVMLGLLAIFVAFNGLPEPGNIVWQNQDWAYSDENDGILEYKSETGMSFTVQVQGSGQYILGFQGQEYRLDVTREDVLIEFPDGQELKGGIIGPDSDKTIVEIDNYLSPEHLPLFYLALEVDRVNRPHGARLFVGIIIMLYGAMSSFMPRGFAKFTLYFRRWMGANSEPTEFNIRSTRNLGGFFVLAGWLIVLMSIWKVF